MDNTYGGAMLAEIKRQPIVEELKRQKQELERRLAEVNAAIKVLEDNPEFQKIYDVLNKVVRY